MSIQAVGWVLENSKSRGITRLVLIALANHANDRRVCYPSQRTIAREAGIAVGTVTNAIRSLVELGEVEVLSTGDARHSAKYRLHLSSAQEMSAQSPGDERSARPKGERSVAPWSEQNHQEPSTTVIAASPPSFEDRRRAKSEMSAMLGKYREGKR